MHESEKWKWSHSVLSDSLRPHRLQPTRLLHPWDFPGKSTGVGCHRLLREDKDCTFFPVSLVNNNIILVGQADQFWQPWWERWILHLPRLEAGGASLERVLNRCTWVRQEALGSHTPVTTGQAGLGALPLSFWSPRALAAWSVCWLWLFRNTVFLPRPRVARRPAVKCHWGRVRGPGWGAYALQRIVWKPGGWNKNLILLNSLP